jgi:enamine deaminase RidA (YjgF/YER057c/UK114 family)
VGRTRNETFDIVNVWMLILCYFRALVKQGKKKYCKIDMVMKQVIMSTVFMADMNNFAAMNEVYDFG